MTKHTSSALLRSLLLLALAALAAGPLGAAGSRPAATAAAAANNPPRVSAPWHPPLMPTMVLPGPSTFHGRDHVAVVLMYHHVGPLPPHAVPELRSLTVSAQRFETDLRELRAAGCHCLTMGQAQVLLVRGQLPRHTVILTFDDGYEDNYTVAWPLMRKYGYVGTFNLVYDSLSAPEHMNREQVKELAAAGNELASHTVSHAILTRIDLAHVRNEVTESREKLQGLSGQPVVTFCYPEGRRNPRVVRAVAEAGYRIAMTVQHGVWTQQTPPLEIPRFRMTEQTDLKGFLGSWLAPRRVRASHRQD